MFYKNKNKYFYNDDSLRINCDVNLPFISFIVKKKRFVHTYKLHLIFRIISMATISNTRILIAKEKKMAWFILILFKSRNFLLR